MKKPDPGSLPREFRADYHTYAAVRLCLSGIFLIAASVACRFVDFSGLKYPAAGAVLLIAAAVAADCVFFGLHRFLKPSWQGTVLKAGAENRIRSAGNKAQPAKRVMVELEIDRGERTPFVLSLYREDKHAVGSQHINVYQTEAPYKEGDTLVYLRGTKVPARFGVRDTEELFDPRFVCAFCGEVCGADREHCPECGRYVLK